MNRIRLSALSLCLLIIAGPLFQSCLRDRCNMEYSYMQYTPVYMTLEDFKNAVQVEAPQALQNPGKIYLLDQYLLINDLGKGIHIYDNADPQNPVALSFLNVPGNYDIAFSCGNLYLDSSTDLLVFDMKNVAAPRLVNRVVNAFPHIIELNGYFADPNKGVVVSWERQMVTGEISCDEQVPAVWTMNEVDPVDVDPNDSRARSVAPATAGKAGSMSRFAVQNDHLYIVSPNTLRSYDLSTCTSPALKSEVNVNFNGGEAEMISTINDALLVGTNNGMFILSNDNPSNPEIIGAFAHATACDPVMASGDYAYVTLRDGEGTTCGNSFTNELDVVSIANLRSPFQVANYSMTNPHGLSIDQDLLFIADGRDGLKIFDATNPVEVGKNQLASIGTYDGYDVIAWDGVAIMTGKDGIAQYSYTTPERPELLSYIPIETN